MRLKKLPAAFFATGNGNRPVREWLYSLDEEDRRLIGVDNCDGGIRLASGNATVSSNG